MKKPVLWIVGGLIVVCGFGAFAMKSFAGGKPDPNAKPTEVKVSRDDLTVTVVENGTVDAEKSVEVKGRVTGRLAKLFCDEGDSVKQGQLLAIIDPMETQLQVEQNAAQLQGATSAVEKSAVEIRQRKLTAQAAYQQAKARAEQLRLALKVQPALTTAAVTEAKTALESAKQDRDRLVNSINPTQRVSSETGQREAKMNLDQAQRELLRQTDLETKGYVSGKTVEDAKLQVDLARAKLDSATESNARIEAQLKADVAKSNEAIRQAQAALDRAQLNAVQDKVKVQEYLSALADIETAKANLMDPESLEKGRQQNLATVAQLSSVLRDAQRQLRETDIRAPITGIVTRRELQVGELATGLSTFGAGSTIVKIEDRTHMRVKLNMNEIDTAKISLGMKAKIDIDALPNDSFTGYVTKIAPASIDSATATTTSVANTDAVVRYQVEIRLDKSVPALRSGMSAKCRLDVVHRDKVIVLPNDYLGKDGKTNFVMLLTGGTKEKPVYTRTTVTVGLSSGSKVEVISGLKEGDTVRKPDYKGPERKGMMSMGPDDAG
jgi:HlyD family secretion protein